MKNSGHEIESIKIISNLETKYEMTVLNHETGRLTGRNPNEIKSTKSIKLTS